MKKTIIAISALLLLNTGSNAQTQQKTTVTNEQHSATQSTTTSATVQRPARATNNTTRVRTKKRRTNVNPATGTVTQHEKVENTTTIKR